MEIVDAFKLRHHLNEILDRLNKTGEPIHVRIGQKIQAVLVTPEQFDRRFSSWQTQERKNSLLSAVMALTGKKIKNESSINVLRRLRGYEE